MLNLQSTNEDLRAKTFPESTARNELLKVAPANLDFSPEASTPVISSAQKFIITVPALGDDSDLLVYPEGPEAGTPILDWEKKPVGERGVVFFNGKDKCWQAVPGNGKGVIIINEVTAEKAAVLLEKIQGWLSEAPALSLVQIKELLTSARNELQLVDMYNSSTDFVAKKMSSVSASFRDETCGCGLMKRNDKDICPAVYIEGPFAFEGPASTPQLFDNGGVIVKIGKEYHGIQPNIFERTYRHASGGVIDLSAGEIKVQKPRTVQ